MRLNDGIVPDHDEDDDGHEEAGTKADTKTKGKKTRGRVKIKMEFIQNKLRRYTTFSKRKTGIMKKVCLFLKCIYFCLFTWLLS